MAILVSLSLIFTAFRGLFRINNLEVKIKLFFVATTSWHDYFLLIKEEDIAVVSFEKNKLGGRFTIASEGDRIRGKERVSTPDTLLLRVLVKGYNTEFLGISGLTGLFFM